MPEGAFGEAAAIAHQGWLIARRWLRGPGLPTNREPAERPLVVFVHGYFAAAAVLDPLQAAIARTTGAETLDFTYGPHRHFESIAEELAERVAARAGGDRSIALVGPSLGGLVARWYLQQMAPHPGVERLVTLATPHRGVPRARLMPGPLARALRPGSPLFEHLAEGRPPVPHLAILGGQDALVPPAIGGAVHAEVVRFDDLTHNQLLYDPRVHRVVARALTRPRGEDTEPEPDAA